MYNTDFSPSNFRADVPRGKGDFEVVKRGTKSQGASVENRPRLDLGNRYDSLRS